jgi:hypothetical protein
MWRHLLNPMTLACFLLPVFLLAAAVILLVVLPVVQAPKLHRITRYARKYLNGRPGASESELRRILRERFVPEWATREAGPGTGLRYGMAGVMVHLLVDVRSYFAVQVIEGRINTAIETVSRE